MATYFIVGGGTGGTVNLGDTAIYSLTSGGASAGVLPVDGDDVVINTASGTNFFVTGVLFAKLKSFTCGASATPRFSNVNITVGNYSTAAAGTFSLVATCVFEAGTNNTFTINAPGAAATVTANFAGVDLKGTALIYFQSSSTVSASNILALGGAILNAAYVEISLSDGIVFNTANNNITIDPASVNIGYGAIRIDPVSSAVVNLGSSTITSPNIQIGPTAFFSGTGTVNLNSSTLIVSTTFFIYANPIINIGTSVVRMLSTVTTAATIDTIGTVSLGTVQLQGYNHIVNSTNVVAFTCSSLAITNAAAVGTLVTLNTNITVTGNLTITGNSLTNRRVITTNGPVYTLSAGSVTLSNVDFENITAAGTATWTGTSLGNRQGNTGITFTTAVTRYAVAAGNWSSTTIWSATNGGASGATVPLPQDTAIVNNLSGSGIIAVTDLSPVLCKDLLIQSGYAGSVSLQANTSLYGNISVANEIVVTNTGYTLSLLQKEGTVTLAYGNRTTLAVYQPGATTLDVTSDIGSTTNTGCTFEIVSADLKTNNFTVHTSNIVAPSCTAGSSIFFVYGGNLFLGTMADNTSTVVIRNTAAFYGTKLNNVYIAVTSAFQQVTGTGPASIYGQITDSNPTYPSTQPYTYRGQTTMEGTSLFNIGNNPSIRVALVNATIVNNTSAPFQTKNASYRNCTASGTFSGADLTAFGLANYGANTNIVFPSRLTTYAFSGTTTSTFSVPSNFTGTALLVAIGGGANGVAGSGGGGGGAYAASEILNYSRGQSLFISPTTSGSDAWLNTSNSPPVSNSTGVLAKGTTSRAGGSSGLSVANISIFGGGTGGTAAAGGGGGGAAASALGVGRNGGNGGPSRTTASGGAGGAGLNGNASNVSGFNGTAGGPNNGGAAGVGGASSTAGGNATTGSGGGGGGAGGGYSTSNINFSGTYTRASASTTLVLDITNHQIPNGQSIQCNFSEFKSGSTYSKTSSSGTAPTTITVSSGHGLSNGQIVYLDFFTGSLTAYDGYYTITFISATQFSVIVSPAATFTASGSVSLRPAPIGNFIATVINSNQISVTTTSNCVMPTTSVIGSYTQLNFDRPGLAGGLSSARLDYTYNFLNGVAATGSIGPGGGGGGGSGSFGLAGGSGGNVVGVGGGGGAGGVGTSNGTAGTGGNALVLFIYAPPTARSFGTIIG